MATLTNAVRTLLQKTIPSNTQTVPAVHCRHFFRSPRVSAKENLNHTSDKKLHYLLFKKWQIHLVKERPNDCNVGAAHKVFPFWSQKTVTHHCLSLFCIVSKLGYRINGF